MKKLIPLFFLFTSIGLGDSPRHHMPNVTNFDTAEIPQGSIIFERDAHDIRPYLSNFEVSQRRFLSSTIGERFALVTLAKNRAGLTGFNRRDIVGILANGERIYPTDIEGNRNIEEQGSLLLHFGIQKFPLVAVETRNE